MIGNDIVEIKKIADKITDRHFLDKVFSEKEREYADKKANPAQTYAGLWAAKESVAKALGCGILGLSMREIEISHTDDGAPQAKLFGKYADLLSKRKISISISHAGEYAFAVAIILN